MSQRLRGLDFSIMPDENLKRVTPRKVKLPRCAVVKFSKENECIKWAAMHPINNGGKAAKVLPNFLAFNFEDDDDDDEMKCKASDSEKSDTDKETSNEKNGHRARRLRDSFRALWDKFKGCWSPASSDDSEF